MSIQLMSRCFDADLPVEGAEQVLLLKLCDLANDDGTCWPGLALLARSVRRQERQVRNLLRLLEQKSLVVVAFGTGPKHTNRYRITLPPKPVDSSTRNTNRQPIAGGNPLPGATERRDTGNAAQHPGNPASIEAAIASAPNPSMNHQRSPTHPAGAPGGVGVITGRDQVSKERKHFERVLDRLGVANGRKALPRWWIQACRNPLAVTFDQRCDLVVWCVEEARSRGRQVSYASDVVDLVDQWLPDGSIDDDHPQAASA